jgi:uncharacterized protein
MTSARKRVVLDTSTLISAAINPRSPSGIAYQLAVELCDVFVSSETIVELTEVIHREKLRRYFAGDEGFRERFVADYQGVAIDAPVTIVANDCADPKDNKFLSLARSVRADFIVSGDKKHLIPMHPYFGIAIVGDQDFVAAIAVVSTQKVAAQP